MSRSHRVWSDVHADNYSTSKSFGGAFRQHIAVGSSATHSNHFASIEVRETHLTDLPNWSIFRLFVDGACTKRALFNNKTKEFAHIALDAVAADIIAELHS